MKPKRHPYSGFKNPPKMASVYKPGLVTFPNVAFRKDLLKHIFSVVKQHDNATIIYFRIPKVFGYEEERAKVYLSYEKTMSILNSYY
jgi:hypothetical protein|nr:MAG TPA: hypothetical protein [Caudoviricetes sp.]